MSGTNELRHGARSTSQVSVYDYPEHLNPFYEDENHKRLRFWKLGRKAGGRESRRGSFSIDGLKEMWAFKSFRLKKKSSSLGINKTSESPPALRKADPYADTYATYDPRVRHTLGLAPLNNSFERNVPYRSSLQDMRSTKDLDSNGYSIGFERNDRYRSTIQTPGGSRNGNFSPVAPPRRYVYGGSMTPQPQPRTRHNGYNTIGHQQNDNIRGMSRGSSQISVASTNPFEDDYYDPTLENGINGTDAKISPTKRPARKKRRAPPPPVPIPKVIDEEPSSVPVSPSTSHANQNEIDENVEITNLTAEIESFVKTTTENSDEQNPTNKTKTETTTNDVVVVTNTNGTPKIFVQQSSSDGGGIKQVTTTDEEHNSSIILESANNSIIIEELPIKDPQKPPRNSKTPHSPGPTASISSLVIDESDKENAEEEDLTPAPVELRITESKEDISEKSEISNDSSEKYHIRYIPLKDSSPDEICNHKIEKHPKALFNEEDELNNGVVTYERRRSVKEIIASINKSQSLLKINHDQSGTTTTPSTTIVNNLNEPAQIRPPPRKSSFTRENIIRNYRDLAESEREIIRLMHEIEDNDHPDGGTNGNELDGDLPEMIVKLKNNNNISNSNNNNNNNDDVFKKCIIKKEINRESSPTASNLDWNPVPKPKRTKNLSPELVGNNAACVNVSDSTEK